MDLTTLDGLKLYMGISADDHSDDARLSAMISAASVALQQWLSRDLESKSRTETFDGTNKQKLLPWQWPITGVTSIKVNGNAIPSSGGVYGVPGWRFDEMRIWLQGPYFFEKGLMNVEVTYTAGYTSLTLPADIAAACNEFVALRAKETQWIGYQSKSLAGESVSFAGLGSGHGRSIADGGIPPSCLAKLSQYKRVHAP